MHDNELEARLRKHLHRRFDNANPSPELTAGIQQALRTEPTGIRLPDLRPGRPLLSWSLVGALGLVAVLAVAAVRFGSVIGPGDPNQTATPPTVVPSAPTERWFVVVPPSGSEPTKTETGFASDVLNARLRTFSFGDGPNAFTSAAGNAITFALPMTGPSDASIFNVLVAPGEVEFVPLPDSYNDGTHVAVVGQPLPTDEEALFGWDGVESVSKDVDPQGRPALTIRLRPAAAEAFGDYTASHVGSYFAIVIDGDVAMAPVVNEPIAGGVIQVSAGALGSADDLAFALASAILVGGELPDAWVPPGVPEILQQDELAARIARELNGVTFESAELDAIVQGPRWIAVWRVRLGGDVTHSCPLLPVDGSRTCPPIDGSVIYTFEAETGEFLSAEPTDP